MDKMCKVYVSQVKAILPVWGKKEKDFVRKLHDNLYDYCEDNNINSIEDLYKGFGTPQEIVFEYISLMEPNEISKRINTAKYIKILAISVITLTLLATMFLGCYAYCAHQTKVNFEKFTVEQVIEYN